MNAGMKTFATVAVAGMLLSAAQAHAAFATYYGIDPSSTSTTAARPNANAAAANFDTALGTFRTGFVNYESNVSGTGRNSTITVAPGVTQTSSNVSPTAGGITTGTSGILGYNITQPGAQFYQLYPVGAAGTHSVTWDFATPINSWGAYITGLGTANGALNIDYVGGGQATIPVNGSSSGGTLFFGFTESPFLVSSVTARLERPAGGSLDIHGYDDIRFGLIPIPEPASLGLIAGAGLLGLRRRQR